MNDNERARLRRIMLSPEGIEDVIKKLDDYDQVMTWYLRSSDFEEPLSFRGHCFFCGRLRADAYGEQDDHTDDCAWWKIASEVLKKC